MTIDYEKLKLAHELCKKIGICLQTGLTTYSDGQQEICCHGKVFDKYFATIEDLIFILEERMQSNNRYQVGEILWFIDYGTKIDEPTFSIKHLECTAVEYTNDILVYILDHEIQLPKSQVYPSRESLIEAQVEYWTCLKNDKKSTRSEYMSMTPPFEGEIKSFNQSENKLDMGCGRSEHHYITIKMSYWLGFTWSALQTLISNNQVSESEKEPIRHLMNHLTPAIEDLFYAPRKE